jgi:hypothetical protein
VTLTLGLLALLLGVFTFRSLEQPPRGVPVVLMGQEIPFDQMDCEDDAVHAYVRADGIMLASTYPTSLYGEYNRLLAVDQAVVLLRKAMATRAERLVIVHADPDVAYGRVVEFIDQSRGSVGAEIVLASRDQLRGHCYKFDVFRKHRWAG